MTQRRVSAESLGAWLLKGNADVTDLAGRFDRDPRIRQWCVQPGYRARLMRTGQPVVFWASGSRRHHAYGVWGIGELTDGAGPQPPDGQWSVRLAVRVVPAEQRVPREQIRADPRLADLEVLRQPQGANPSFLTVPQFSALMDHFGPAAGAGPAVDAGSPVVACSCWSADGPPDCPCPDDGRAHAVSREVSSPAAPPVYPIARH
jgi:hypothetical protein